VFVIVNHFHPGAMLQVWNSILRTDSHKSSHVCSSLYCKYKTRTELSDSDKRSSLFVNVVQLKRNSFLVKAAAPFQLFLHQKIVFSKNLEKVRNSLAASDVKMFCFLSLEHNLFKAPKNLGIWYPNNPRTTKIVYIIFLQGTPSVEVRGLTWAQCYKTFGNRNLQMFVIC
jgi:hypothetical protein